MIAEARSGRALISGARHEKGLRPLRVIRHTFGGSMSHRRSTDDPRTPARRDCKSDGEIRQIVHEEGAEWRAEVRQTMADMRKAMDGIGDVARDGAQASMNAVTIFIGSAENGIEGALPRIDSRLKGLEANQIEDREAAALMHSENSDRLAELEKKAEVLEKQTGRIRKTLARMYKEAISDTDGNMSYPKMAALIGAVGTAVHLVPNYVPWISVKKTMFAAWQAMGK